MTPELELKLGDRSYKIEIGTGLLQSSPVFDQICRNRPLLVVSNPTVAAHYLKALLKRIGLETPVFLMNDGEQFKNLETFDALITQLLECGCGRDTLLLALGGGVVGDLTGFAAATYQRGIDFIQLPTTLLAQVDASVGGKTAINHRSGKNMVGAFHQPQAVIIDTDTLASLPAREYAAGLAEVVKYTLLVEDDFLGWLEHHTDAILRRESALLQQLVTRCCRIKAEIVAADEREQGRREWLNLGHTFAHAIETETGYRRYLHGEAVAMGLVAAQRCAIDLGLERVERATRVRELLQRLGLPVRIEPALETDHLIEHMRRDKKTRGGVIRLVLPCFDAACRVVEQRDAAALARFFPFR